MIVLVNEKDEVIGEAEKLKAHEQGWLHRAFSVFIYRTTPNLGMELLLQKRQVKKYHSGGLWTNTCCSHPAPGEEIKTAATRRLQEEMGLSSKLAFLGKFCYEAHFDNGLIEHEWDYVFLGQWKGDPILFNPEEVQSYCWKTVDQIVADLEKHPEKYTFWFKQALDFIIDQVKN